MRQTPKVLEVKNVLEVLYHYAKFGGARISPAAGVAKTLSFLSVCLFVCSSRVWTSEIVRPISPWRHWSTETILTPLDRGRFVVLYPCLTLSDCCQLATTLNAEVQKRQKLEFFANRGRQNKPNPDEIWHASVYRGSAIAHQIWPSSVKGVGTGAPK